jgi:hypothetical protein
LSQLRVLGDVALRVRGGGGATGLLVGDAIHGCGGGGGVGRKKLRRAGLAWTEC